MNLERQYKDMLMDAITYGIHRDDRTGVGSTSIFSPSLRWDLQKFPLMTSKAMYPKIFKTEFEWFINGETNIRRFQDAGIKIWDAWADENGDLGPVYGHQMLNFNDQSVNQLEAVIDSLTNNPDSRRHIISLWNPVQIDLMALPPCYLYFQFFVDHNEKLNMFVVQRSGDLFLGIPYDIALFSQILLYISEKCRYLPGKIDLQIVDCHVYDNQHEAIRKYVTEETYPQPDYTYKDHILKIDNYQHGPVISAPVAV